MTADQLCDQAQQQYQAGNSTTAETLYRAALESEPRHAEAMHRLGRLYLSAGQTSRAIAFIENAVTIKPRTPAYRESLGLALRAAGRTSEAVAAFRHAARLDKSSFGAQYNLGNALYSLGQFPEAAQSFRRAIAIDPKFSGAHNNLGNTLRAMADHARAVEAFQAAIALDPNAAELHVNLASVRLELNQPNHAIPVLNQALALNPAHSQALLLLSEACQRTGNLDGAEQALRRGLELFQNDVTLISELAILAHLQGRQDEAGAYFRHIIASAPNEAKYYNNYALWLRETGDLNGSETQFRAGLALAPDEPLLHYGLALTLLCMGRLREGFAEYEWRWLALKHPIRQTAPAWTGEPDPERTLLIVAEQGQGDVIHFLRYIPHAASRMRVALEIYPSLHRLAASIPGIATLYRTGEPEPEHHAVCPLMSLPRALGLDETPLGTQTETPYLRPSPEAASRWSLRTATLPGRKIGLVWAGGSGFSNDRLRSVPPALFDQLASGTVSFVSLQKGRTEKPNLPMADWTNELNDFADTAALIANLDLVISVDTAVAHLAGALGKPVWLLNRFDSDWRWGREGETTPWYPSMRQFRQPSLGDWKSVMLSIKNALNTL